MEFRHGRPRVLRDTGDAARTTKGNCRVGNRRSLRRSSLGLCDVRRAAVARQVLGGIIVVRITEQKCHWFSEGKN